MPAVDPYAIRTQADEHAVAIADALSADSGQLGRYAGLTALDLSRNGEIGERGAAALEACVRFHNTALLRVDLARTAAHGGEGNGRLQVKNI